MNTYLGVRVPGMDGLLGLIIALMVFALIIFLAGRSVRYVAVVAVCIILLAALVFFGVVG